MARARLLSVALLCLAPLFLLQVCQKGPAATAFTGPQAADTANTTETEAADTANKTETEAADTADTTETASRSMLSYFPLYELTTLGHTGYPVPMMFGFICRGNVELRRACGGKPYPNWLLGFLLGFMCYTYPANIMSDTLFAPGVLRGFTNNNIVKVYTFWFLLVQGSESVYKFLTSTHVNILLTVWFIWDATHASLCFLERAVSPPLGTPVFSRGLFQCFVWCCAAAIFQNAEKAIRGVPTAKMDAVIPNTFNIFAHPVPCMWFGMVFYMLYLMHFTDCGVFQKGGKSLFECGVEHPDLYAMLHYIPMVLHVRRAYAALAKAKPVESPVKKMEEGLSAEKMHGA